MSCSIEDTLLLYVRTFYENPFAGFTEEDLLHFIRNAAEDGLVQTGEFQYSNFGFYTLAYILGRATATNDDSATSFPVIQKTMTDQLGMSNTWIETLPDEIRKQHLSRGSSIGWPVPYSFDGGVMINGAGSTLSSANDMSLFLEKIMSAYRDDDTMDTLLQNALKLSLTPLHPIPDSNGGIAYSWFFDQLDRGTVYYHNGATGGFDSNAIFQPQTQTGIVALSSCSSFTGLMSLVAAPVASKLFGGLPSVNFPRPFN